MLHFITNIDILEPLRPFNETVTKEVLDVAYPIM